MLLGHIWVTDSWLLTISSRQIIDNRTCPQFLTSRDWFHERLEQEAMRKASILRGERRRRKFSDSLWISKNPLEEKEFSRIWKEMRVQASKGNEWSKNPTRKENQLTFFKTPYWKWRPFFVRAQNRSRIVDISEGLVQQIWKENNETLFLFFFPQFSLFKCINEKIHWP